MGSPVGQAVDNVVGKVVGQAVENVVGSPVGQAVENVVGKVVGQAVGQAVGLAVGLGAVVKTVGQAEVVEYEIAQWELSTEKPLILHCRGKQLFDAVTPDSTTTLHPSLVQSQGRERCSILQLVKSDDVVQGNP